MLLLAALLAAGLPDLLRAGRVVTLPDPAQLDAGASGAGGLVEGAPRCRGADTSFACVRWIAPGGHGSDLSRPPRVSSGMAMVAGGDDATVRGVALGTGATRWQRTLPGRDRLELLAPIAGGVPVVHGRDLAMLEVRSGAPRWRHARAFDRPPHDAVTAGPWILAADGEQVSAHSPGNGERVWSHALETGQQAVLSPYGAFVVDRRRLTLLSVHQNIPDVRWRAAIDRPFGVAAVTGELVLLRTSPGLVALDRTTGRQRWELSVSSPTVTDAGGVLLVTSPTRDIRVHLQAVDVVTGEVRWSRRYDGTPGVGPAVAGDLAVVFAGAATPTATAVGLRDGRQRWRTTLRAPADAAVAVGGDVIVSTGNGAVGVSGVTGSRRWSLPVGPARVVVRSPLVLSSATRLLAVEPPVVAADGDEA